jgi:phytoene synthase
LAADDLDESVRRADPDRWLASRFVADRGLRADLISLYAFDLELDRARRVTTSPLTAEIRLTWWWEVIGEIFGDRTVRAHPVALAMQDVLNRRPLPRNLFEAMIDARIDVLGATTLDEPAALRWADGAGGSIAVLAASLLDPSGRSELARPAGRLLGLASLVRDGRLDRTSGRTLLRRALADADAAARALAPAAFPAVAAAALVDAEIGGGPTSELRRRLRLAWAVARGRL